MTKDFHFKTYSGSTSLPDRIIFVFIHYDRLNIITKTTSSLISFLCPEDGIWIIDNGSRKSDQELLDQYLSKYSASCCSISASYVQTNNAGTFALEMLLSKLGNSLYPNATHFIVVGDDDYILFELYNQLPKKLDPTDVYTWGFDYYDHQAGIRSSTRNHTGQTYVYDSKSCFNFWISQYTFYTNPYSRFISKLKFSSLFSSETSEKSIDDNFELPYSTVDSHNSASLMPIKSLKTAIEHYGSIVTYPFGDVGSIILLKFSEKFLYFDRPLSLIGRGSNYGMSCSLQRMESNHRLIKMSYGFPSQLKWTAISYVHLYRKLGVPFYYNYMYSQILFPHVKMLFGGFGADILSYIRQRFQKKLFKKTFYDVVLELLIIALFLIPFTSSLREKVSKMLLFCDKGEPHT